MNPYYLLLWPVAGLLALGITLYQLRRYGSNLAELVAFLNQQNPNKPQWLAQFLCAAVIVLGPISLVPIVLDAFKRARMNDIDVLTFSTKPTTNMNTKPAGDIMPMPEYYTTKKEIMLFCGVVFTVAASVVAAVGILLYYSFFG